MSGRCDPAATADVARVWRAVEDWDKKRPKTLELAAGQAQLYMGAMEIPLVAFWPLEPVKPDEDRMNAFAPALARFGLELDCVEVGSNYKINRSDTKEYVGRILPDALKLHVERILDIGQDAFRGIVMFYLGLGSA